MSKYRNSKVALDGLKFDSKLEASHYLLLKNRLRRGEIKRLARQVEIELTKNSKNNKDKVRYVADFVFFDLSLNSWVIFDSKGVLTDAYKIKRKWLLDRFCGFRFYEHTSKEVREFEPNGSELLSFE